jgi:hypothetical protein
MLAFAAIVRIPIHLRNVGPAAIVRIPIHLRDVGPATIVEF